MPRVVVDVMLKPEILDPQGRAVMGAFTRLGVHGVADVRQGKRFEITLDGDATDEAMADLHQDPTRVPADWQWPRRIVYVSCSPATLARDAGLLVHQAGYRCTAAGVVNMFPHTAHVESIAVFERDDAA